MTMILLRTFLASGYILLVPLVGCSQTLQIGINGFQRIGILQVDGSNDPIVVKNREGRRFSYGINATYQKGHNGVELSWTNFPYRADLLYKNLVSSYGSPNEISLYSILYRRTIISLDNRKIRFYLSAGIGAGPYQNKAESNGVQRITDGNNNLIFKGTLDRQSNYNRSIILLPIVKAELEKTIFNNVLVSVYGAYTAKNFFGYKTPLERGTYQLEYRSQTQKGNIASYGNGYLIGVAMKYQIHLK